MWFNDEIILGDALAWRRIGGPVRGEVLTMPACLRGAEVLAVSWIGDDEADEVGRRLRQVLYYARLPRDPYKCGRRVVAVRLEFVEYDNGVTCSQAYLAELPRHIAQQLGLVS